MKRSSAGAGRCLPETANHWSLGSVKSQQFRLSIVASWYLVELMINQSTAGMLRSPIRRRQAQLRQMSQLRSNQRLDLDRAACRPAASKSGNVPLTMMSNGALCKC
jgi:hypothetical protein